MRDAFVSVALRTPVGKHGGALAGVRPDDLAAVPIKAVVERSGIDPAAIDDVILGCANQAGEDNRNVARMALLLAGLPVEVPGQTVNRLCGSGLQAAASAAQAIKAGEGETFIAGGVESMTRAPYVMLKSGEPWSRKAPETADTTVGWRFVNPRRNGRSPSAKRRKSSRSATRSRVPNRTRSPWKASNAPSGHSRSACSRMSWCRCHFPMARHSRRTSIREPERRWMRWRSSSRLLRTMERSRPQAPVVLTMVRRHCL